MQIGMVFNPKWTDAIVVVSEVLARLPARAQYPYVEYVLDQFKPNKWVTDIFVATTLALIHLLQGCAPRLVCCIKLCLPRIHPSAQRTGTIPYSYQRRINRKPYIA